MPVTLTASRALRQSRARAVINLRRKRILKKAVDTFKASAKLKDLSPAISQIDRALKHHLVNHRKAARLKSRLSKLVTRSQSSSTAHASV